MTWGCKIIRAGCLPPGISKLLYLSSTIYGGKPTDYAWLLNHYCRWIGTGEEFSIFCFHLLLLASALCLPARLRLKALRQVLHCSGCRDLISSPADKGLTPYPSLLQEKDLERIAASFLRHTQMLNINVGSSVKIVSCYSSDGKNIWMK